MLICALNTATVDDIQPRDVIVPVAMGTVPDSDPVTVMDFVAVDDSDGEDDESFVIMVTGLSQISLATVLIRDNDNGIQMHGLSYSKRSHYYSTTFRY